MRESSGARVSWNGRSVSFVSRCLVAVRLISEWPMILGVGLDVVETERVARALAAHGRRFEERVYSPAELAGCAHRVDRAQALAVRFAAKEAFLKPLGTGWVRGLSLRQVEGVAQHGGRPA